MAQDTVYPKHKAGPARRWGQNVDPPSILDRVHAPLKLKKKKTKEKWTVNKMQINSTSVQQYYSFSDKLSDNGRFDRLSGRLSNI